MTYNQKKPRLATITERYSISKEESKKDTQHLVINLKGSGVTYEPGDSLGVIPLNCPHHVAKTLQMMKASGDEIIVDKRSSEEKTLHDFLLRDANISKVTKKILRLICEKQTNSEKKQFLENLFNDENKEKLTEYLGNHQLWDLLEEHSEVTFNAQELSEMVTRMIPRLYSIASSMKEVGDEVHLIVAVVTYETNGHKRYGVCSNYLGHRAALNEKNVRVYVQPNAHFNLPEDQNTPVIMVGPGTGVAPFRAFMQERMAVNAAGKNWLFFGDWTKKNDFFYEEYWTSLVEQDKLRLDAAFSRDQDYKIYVQNKIAENAADVWQWIQEGAYIYVCGDASRMAKDVESTLIKIAEEQGKMLPEDATNYIFNMIKDKKYLKDVY